MHHYWNRAQIICAQLSDPSDGNGLYALDASFRNQVLGLVDDEYRARAPEPGIDPECVVRHCNRARVRKAWRDALLCIPLIYVLWTLFPELALAAANPNFIPLILTGYWLRLVVAWFAASGIVFGEAFLTEILPLTYRLRATTASASSMMIDRSLATR